MNDTENEIRRKRLIYRANHRGIKEMDIILGRFASAKLADIELEMIDEFERLLNENDRDLLIWFTGEAEFPHDDMRQVFDLIKTYVPETSAND